MAERLRFPPLAREMAAEFAGTMILILFGVGVVAQVVVGGALADGGLGDHDSIAWAWGIGVILGVYVAARITGGHINPAVTITLAVFNRLPWSKVGPYVLAQVAGAFTAALIVRWNYMETLARTDPGHDLDSVGVFITLPGNGNPAMGVHMWGGFRDQIIGTAILLFIVMALTDVRNNPPLSNLTPVVIGLLVVAIGMAWGTNAGYAINPARDFGPRLVTFLTGYGGDAWQDQNGDPYFWVPIVGPIIGGIIGAALYLFLIGRNLPPADEAEEVSAQRKPEYDPAS
jgi:glycerol uptake facilitator protein